MDAQKLVDTIPLRKSVRSISGTPLPESVLDDIQSFADQVPRLFPEVKTEMRILSSKGVVGIASVFAPHYMAIYAERSPEADLNCGFMLEQVDLFLSSRGLGSCWLGMTKPAEREYNGLPFVILLAFGSADEPVHRSSPDQFKRKPIDEISSPGVMPAWVQLLRMAPSAMNKQPWYFSGDAHCLRAFSERGKGIINIAESWRFVDLGIALSFLYLAATSSGKTVTFRREDSIPAGTGSEYVISCYVN